MSLNIFARIESLYSEIPTVNCLACGYCCVSPSCMLAEFMYLIRYCIDHLSADDLRRRILALPAIHPDHDGNIYCRFQEGMRCCIHPARTAACRLFGLPATKQFLIGSDAVHCPYSARWGVLEESGQFNIQSLLYRLVAFDEELYAVEKEPYFVRGFNLECWFDIYYDNSLDFDVFADIRNVMHRTLPELEKFAPYYQLRTGLREKIDKITIFSMLIGKGSASQLRSLLISIRDHYLFTGTYFQDEAQTYLDKIDSTTHDAAPL